MSDKSNEQVRALTAEEMERVTGGFLGQLIRKVGRAPAKAAPLNPAEAPAEGPSMDLVDS